MKAMKTWKTAMTAAIVLSASAALAAPMPAVKCQASKGKLVGQYYACRQKADASVALKGGAADYSKCTTKFGEKWLAAETRGNSECPDNVALAPDMDAYLSGQASEAAAIVAGTQDIPVPPTPPVCGDGAINDGGEHCDGANLDGYTCAAFGLHGSLSCTAGCDFNLSGCTSCPAPGVEYAGTCWVLGAEGADCDAACATLGMVYSDSTAIVAGSDGSDVNCVALLDAFSAPGGALDNPGGDCPGFAGGCAVIPDAGFRARCGTPATTAEGIFVDAQRVCACQ